MAPECAELRPLSLTPPGDGEVCVRALFGALSRGTERLILQGRVPEAEYARMRAPHMRGDFPFPVNYGYAVVGVVEEGSAELRGRTVFCLHPHADRFVVAAEAVVAVPEGVPPARAVLAANAETALNAVWDAAAAPADRIAIVGGGVVGMLVAWLCARLPGAEVTLVDIDPARAEAARGLGAGFALPDEAPTECDVVFHTSASAEGLKTALRIAGNEARVVEMSWYGTDSPSVPLGGAFHSRRLSLVSSQVGQVSPSRRSRWSHRRRLGAALALLADPALDRLLAPAVAFRDLPDQIAALLAPAGGVLCPLIAYPAAADGR